MNGLVLRSGSHVIEQEHGRVALVEKMLQSQDLPPVEKGPLRQ
jgi:hypothetical protein